MHSESTNFVRILRDLSIQQVLFAQPGPVKVLGNANDIWHLKKADLCASAAWYIDVKLIATAGPSAGGLEVVEVRYGEY